MSLVFKDDDVLDKYNEIWDKITETTNVKFHKTHVSEQKQKRQCFYVHKNI